MSAERRTLVAQLNNAFADFKDMHQKSKQEIKTLGYETKETREILEKLHDRMDNVETVMNRPRFDSIQQSEKSAYTKAFDKWFRTGDEESKSVMAQEVKVTFPNMNETIDPDGGYFIAPEYAGYILETLTQYSPIRKLARKVKVNAKDFKIPVQQQQQNLITGAPLQGLFKTGWTADLGPVSQTDTGQIGMKIIPTNDLYSLPFATQDMLDDAAFDLERYIQENLAKSIAYYEGNAFVKGTGVGQPKGILTGIEAGPDAVPATSLIEPPAGTLQWSLGLSPDILIDAFYAIPQYYSDRGTWLLNRQTLRVIREWVDGRGQYLWTPSYGVTVGERAPATILGAPYQECIDFPNPNFANAVDGEVPFTAGTKTVIVFGSIEDAYTIVDRMGIRVLRDPYTQKPFVQFYTTYRVGGQMVLPEALAAIQVRQT